MFNNTKSQISLKISALHLVKHLLTLEPIAFIFFFIFKNGWRKEFRSVGVMPLRELFGIIANEIHNVNNLLRSDWLVGNEVHDKLCQPIINNTAVDDSRLLYSVC